MKNDDTNNEDQVMLQGITEELDRSLDRLDGSTLSRLNKIRHDAINKASGNTVSSLFFPGSLVATCLLASVFIIQTQFFGASEQVILDVPSEDVEIWASTESIEFFEDLEFYQWLAENDPSV